jgi:hypothetical protein
MKHTVIVIMLVLLWTASISIAQQPTATLTAFNGDVVVVVQGKQVPPAVGMVLTQGDTLQIQDNAAATLTLSDGSVIQLGKNTKVDLALLLQSPETGARQSRLKLWYGRIKLFLSFEHQKEGSSFEMETPNAQIGVKFSQPWVESDYDPRTNTTIARAYTIGVRVVNLLTKAEVQMPQGHQAVIREDFILVTKIMEITSVLDQIERMAQDRLALTALEGLPETDRLADAWQLVGVNGPATSQMPALGTRSTPAGRSEVVGFSLDIDLK